MGKLKSVQELFEGRHFDREVIILCVRWYLRFKLSLRDLVEMMARGPWLTRQSCAGCNVSLSVDTPTLFATKCCCKYISNHQIIDRRLRTYAAPS